MNVPTGPTGPLPVESYNFNLSAAGSSGSFDVGSITFTLSHVSTSDIRLIIRPSDLSKPVLIDLKRFGVFDATTAQSFIQNNYTLSGNLTVDDTIHTNSNDWQITWLRQRNPVTLKWSLCEYSVFASQNGSRVSLWVRWVYKEIDLP